MVALIGAGVTLGLRPEISGGARTPVQQHHGNGVAGHSVETAAGALDGGPAKIAAGIDEALGDWRESPCIRSDEQPAPIQNLWKIGTPQAPERPLGYSALDHCTPIFIAGPAHFDVDLLRGAGMSLEGFYEKTATGGRIEVDPNALMEKTERYRAVVLAHEELHAVLDWLDPVRLNEALLPTRVVAKARAQLRETGYEEADVDDEILPRLLDARLRRNRTGRSGSGGPSHRRRDAEAPGTIGDGPGPETRVPTVTAGPRLDARSDVGQGADRGPYLCAGAQPIQSSDAREWRPVYVFFAFAADFAAHADCIAFFTIAFFAAFNRTIVDPPRPTPRPPG